MVLKEKWKETHIKRMGAVLIFCALQVQVIIQLFECILLYFAIDYIYE